MPLCLSRANHVPADKEVGWIQLPPKAPRPDDTFLYEMLEGVLLQRAGAIHRLAALARVVRHKVCGHSGEEGSGKGGQAYGREVCCKGGKSGRLMGCAAEAWATRTGFLSMRWLQLQVGLPVCAGTMADAAASVAGGAAAGGAPGPGVPQVSAQAQSPSTEAGLGWAGLGDPTTRVVLGWCIGDTVPGPLHPLRGARP